MAPRSSNRRRVLLTILGITVVGLLVLGSVSFYKSILNRRELEFRTAYDEYLGGKVGIFPDPGLVVQRIGIDRARRLLTSLAATDPRVAFDGGERFCAVVPNYVTFDDGTTSDGLLLFDLHLNPGRMFEATGWDGPPGTRIRRVGNFDARGVTVEGVLKASGNSGADHNWNAAVDWRIDEPPTTGSLELNFPK